MTPRSSELGLRAHAFAKQYVVLVDALRKEGVPESVARDEARTTALVLLFDAEENAKETTTGHCALCGRGE